MVSDLRTRIGAVQRAHRLTSFGANYVQCECGWKSPEKYATWTDHPEHVADAVIRELDRDYILVPKSHTLAKAAEEWLKSDD